MKIMTWFLPPVPEDFRLVFFCGVSFLDGGHFEITPDTSSG